MRLRDVIKAEKEKVSYGQWKTGGMPKSLFPLTKTGKRTLRFRGSYEWCIVTFRALSCDFKLLIAVNYSKEQYYAHLGMECGSEMRMLASYEFHGTHPGWHVHAGCDDWSLIPVGRYEGPWKRTIPSKHELARRKSYGVTDQNRMIIALDFFGVSGGSNPDGQLSWI